MPVTGTKILRQVFSTVTNPGSPRGPPTSPRACFAQLVVASKLGPLIGPGLKPRERSGAKSTPVRRSWMHGFQSASGRGPCSIRLPPSASGPGPGEEHRVGQEPSIDANAVRNPPGTKTNPSRSRSPDNPRGRRPTADPFEPGIGAPRIRFGLPRTYLCAGPRPPSKAALTPSKKRRSQPPAAVRKAVAGHNTH